MANTLLRDIGDGNPQPVTLIEMNVEFVLLSHYGHISAVPIEESYPGETAAIVAANPHWEPGMIPNVPDGRDGRAARVAYERGEWKPSVWTMHVASASAPCRTIAAPVVSAPETRPREHRSSSSTAQPRAPDDDRPRLGLQPRPCAGCGEPFVPSRPNRRHCSPGCRVRAHRLRATPAPEQTDRLLALYREAVWKARRAGDLDKDEALDLLANPPPRVLELLARQAA